VLVVSHFLFLGWRGFVGSVRVPRRDLADLRGVARADPLAGDLTAVAEGVELEARHPRRLPRPVRSVQRLSRGAASFNAASAVIR
jgi:hypothetical protein